MAQYKWSRTRYPNKKFNIIVMLRSSWTRWWCRKVKKASFTVQSNWSPVHHPQVSTIQVNLWETINIMPPGRPPQVYSNRRNLWVTTRPSERPRFDGPPQVYSIWRNLWVINWTSVYDNSKRHFLDFLLSPSCSAWSQHYNHIYFIVLIAMIASHALFQEKKFHSFF